MRNDLDFAPLYRSSVGFDRVFNLLNKAQRLRKPLNPFHLVHRLFPLDNVSSQT
jgi:hypothetical protein